VQQGVVVYLAAEGAYGFRCRVEAFRQRRLAEDAAPTPFYLVAARLDLIGEYGDFVGSIRSQLPDGIQPSAIAIDTINRTLWGSESKDEDMALYLAGAEAVRDAFDCLVVLVHHTGLDATRPRGHTSLSGAVDQQVAVRRAKDGRISSRVEWSKDAVEGAELWHRLEPVEIGVDPDGDGVSSCVVEPAEPPQATVQVGGQAGVALDVLRRAVEEAGERPPASQHVPAGRRVVTVDLWRRYCAQEGLSGKGNPDAEEKAFHRARTKLQNEKLVRVWGDFVWPVTF
jgi:hypothetical protein